MRFRAPIPARRAPTYADRSAMALNLIHGPPNSGKAGLVRARLLERLAEDPALVVPTADDAYGFERELSENGAILGASVITFRGLFEAVAAAGPVPPPPELTPAQRLGAVAVAVAGARGALGPLSGSARRPGFVRALAGLFDELQSAGSEPADVEAAAGTLEGSAYLGDIATLFAGYTRIRDELGHGDAHTTARAAIHLLSEQGECWRGRPVYLYGFDDLTPNQLALVAALAEVCEVTVALPYEEESSALRAREELLASLHALAPGEEETTDADAGNTESPLLFHLEREFGAATPQRAAPDDSLAILRSAGERGEAEAIGAEVARLLADGIDPEQIAVVIRDPGRRGPLLSAVLESYGIHTALDAELPLSGTAVGGALVALLEAALGSGRAEDLLRYLRGPSGVSARRVDWFERALRRKRIGSAAAALALWSERNGEPPPDLAALRAAGDDPTALAAAVAQVAATMAARVRQRAESEDNAEGAAKGARSLAAAALEARAAGAVATALGERAALPGLAPGPRALAPALAELSVRAWTGPATGRVRIGDPARLRAARFDHVFVASLQDGEFPRREGRADPFLSERQRGELGLPARRDSDAEERYFFHACLALPRRRLVLSYRDSDENGAAEPRSPFLDEVRGLLDPPPPADGEPDPVEAALTRGRDLAQVVHPADAAPSARELARSLAAATTREPAPPGPLREPAVLERLAAVPAYGGTTLEGFDVCSYRWFVNHELRPQRLDPDPDPIVQGGLMHESIERLYGERPGGDPLPRPDSLAAWIERGRELIDAVAAERGLGEHPSERAMVRRVKGLLARFLGEEAKREARFRPWLLEASFGEDEEAERPLLEIDGWALHGAIDRVDRDDDGRALVIDYKVASSASSRAKLEEEAKLQLQLYLIAVAELWDAPIVGGVYYPMRATSQRRPRGLVLDEAAEPLSSLGLAGTDLVEREQFEEALSEARRRAAGIVARMRAGDIRRDPGPRAGLRNHDVCPQFCDLAPICRRDRAPAEPFNNEDEQ